MPTHPASTRISSAVRPLHTAQDTATGWTPSSTDAADVDPVAVLSDLGGVARRRDLEAAGVTRAQLAAAVAAREVDRVRPGGYALPGTDAELVTALRHSATLTCVSALATHGFDLLHSPVTPHLSSPGQPGRGSRGCVWHRDVRQPRIADVLPAAARALRCVEPADGLAIADQVLRRGWERADLQARIPLRGSTKARWVITHADRRSESVLESALRYALLEYGITDVDLQVQIPGVGRVDMVVNGWLILEADGKKNHLNATAFDRDRRRVVTAMRSGWLTMRFFWDEVVDDPVGTAAAVQDVLDRTPGGRFSTLVTTAPGHAAR